MEIQTDEQMKRLAQQEYNNMLEELQEDDNADDDGEILETINLLLNSVDQLHIYSNILKKYFTNSGRNMSIRHRCKLLAT